MLDTSIKAIWTESKDELKSSSDGIEWAFISPADNSESAIGIFFFYKDLFGKIVVGISLLLSLTIFIIGCFKRHNRRLIFLLTTVNLLSISAFVVDALINNVQLLYGAWLCLALITLAVALQYWEQRRTLQIENYI